MTSETEHPLRLWSAFGITSLGNIAAICFGIVTNKILATTTSTHGIATLGLYRTLTAVLTQSIGLGSSFVIVTRIAQASGDARKKQISLARILLRQQSVVLLAVAIALAWPVSFLLFGRNAFLYFGPTLLAMVLAIGPLAMQTELAVLNGQGKLAKATLVGTATAASTCMFAYPLVLLGDWGIAALIGSTCFLGAAIALKLTNSPWRKHLRRNDWTFRELPVSASLTLQPLIVMGSMLLLQALLSQKFGLDALGLYTSATTIETTSMTLLGSIMSTYFLPALQRLEKREQKSELSNQLVQLLVPFACAGTAFIVAVSPNLLRLLFSADFSGATQYLVVLVVAILPQTFSWCFGFFLIGQGRNRLYLALSFSENLALLVGVCWCIGTNAPLLWIAYLHVTVCSLSAISYGIFSSKGPSPLRMTARTWLSAIGAAVTASVLLGEHAQILRMVAGAAFVIWCTISAKNFLALRKRQ